MTTEDVSSRTLDLDMWENLAALKALHEDQIAAVAAVGPALPVISAAVEAAVPRLQRGGRLVYVGAGTAGRLGAQDGAELLPTFNWPDRQLALVIAGGEKALLHSVENAEDASGAEAIANILVGADDVVIALAASGNTPFTVSAARAAKARGALVIGIANNHGTPLLDVADHAVLLDTGAEVIAGSTRLKAGTAQKVALNLISTLAMVRLGRVYRGMMVEMRATNEKLRRRSVRMVAAIADSSPETAADALAQADGDIKLASLIATGAPAVRARALLDKHDRFLRPALAEARGAA